MLPNFKILAFFWRQFYSPPAMSPSQHSEIAQGVSIFQARSLRICLNSQQAKKKGIKRTLPLCSEASSNALCKHPLSEPFLSVLPETAEKILFLFASSVYLCPSLATLLNYRMCERGNGLINRLKKIEDFSESLQQYFFKIR